MTIALISASLVSCEREADMLIDEMEQQQALAMLDTDALRSMKPIYNGKPANITHEGEKGRDRRDNMGNDRMKIKYSAMTEMKVGDIYVTGYDASTDEYSAEIYWGEELDEEMKKMFTFAQASLIFKRNGFGQIYNTSYHQKLYFAYYEPGDKFIFPGELCWTCTDITVSINYCDPAYPNARYNKTWTLPFESLRYVDLKDKQIK